MHLGNDVVASRRALTELNPDFTVSFGGGSTIDATKAAGVLRALGGRLMNFLAQDW